MQRTLHKEQNCALLENSLVFRGQDHVKSIGTSNKTIVLKAFPPSKALFCNLMAYRLQKHNNLFKYSYPILHDKSGYGET